MLKSSVKRGDIFYYDYGKGKGSVQGGIRPCVIIQNDIGNTYSPTVIVAAITSELGKNDIPTHVNIGTECGLKKPSLILLEQIRTVNKTELKRFVGHAGTNVLEKINKALGISLDIKKEKEDANFKQSL